MYECGFCLVYLQSAVTNDATTYECESASPTIAINRDDERRASDRTIVAARARGRGEEWRE